MKKVIIGIGNSLKNDDNIGNIVVDELEKKSKDKNNLFIRADTNPENFIGVIRKFNPDIIYFVDAVDFDGEVGEVKVFGIDAVLNESLSTHGISVKVFKEFFPVEIKIIGIKPGNIEYGEDLSESLELDSISNEVKNILYQKEKLHYSKKEKKE